MDIKQKINSKLKSLVKEPSVRNAEFTSSNFQFMSDLFRSQKTTSGSNDLNSQSNEKIECIQENHLPIFAHYTKQKESRETKINPYLTNSILEQEIIDSIEQIYYNDLVDEENKIESVIEDTIDSDQLKDDLTQNDVCEHILNKLPNAKDSGFILQEKKKLNIQLHVVTKRVSDLIQQNQCTYNQELESIIELQTILTEAINICSSGRFKLDIARKNLTYPNLNIISTYRRREIMISLVQEFYTIKTLLQTELTLKDLIVEDEDYASAIKLCLECLKIIGSINHYKCVADLGVKLKCTIEMIEDRMDMALAKLCLNFNSFQFNKIRQTFDLLEKTQFLYDQLLIHFSTVINEKTFKIVNSYVELCTNLNESLASSTNMNSIKDRDFEDVCALLSSDCFLPCLIDFNKSMWHIMITYKRFINTHKFDSSITSIDQMNEKQELDCNSKLIKQKLHYGLNKVWQEIENKLTVLIKNHNLSIYSFDDFISMINIVRKMISIGCEFSDTKQSDRIEEALNKATSEYFYVYHKNKMEDIKVFLKNELWQLVPMKSDFSIDQLHEFNFLRNERQVTKVDIDNEEQQNYFNLKSIESESRETPFDKYMSSRKSHSDANDSMGDEQLDYDIDRIDKHDSSELPVIITNSSLNILRIVGKYMQIMFMLNQISFDVLLCIFHLFDYYLYSIYIFFGNDKEIERQLPFQTYSPDLMNLLKRIELTIINSNRSASSDNRMKFDAAELSEIVNLNNKDHLFGLFERAIGVESLVFLASQFKEIYTPLLLLVNEKDKIWLEQFFNKTVNVSMELREPIYIYVACKYIQYDQIVQSMERINWEVKEIMSQHNLYVDQLIQDLQLFRLKENDMMLKLVNHIFVEGFSTAKKCTNEGRALMQLDYQHYLCKIEHIVSIKPIPNKEFVEEYIKAYYYTEDQLENLIKSKQEYTVKQLKSLVNCTLNDNKKGRQRLLTLIDSEHALSK